MFRKLLVTRLLLIVLIFSLLSGLAIAQDVTLYQDPAGRFSLPIPTGWTDTSTPEVGRLVSPDGLTLSILALKAVDAPSGDQAALVALAPDLVNIAPAQVNVASAPSGTWTQNLYIQADGGITALVTQWVEGTTYVLLFEAKSQDTFSANQAQILDIIFQFSVGKRLDLTGVIPQLFTDAMRADLATYIEAAQERFHVSGVSIAIVQNGQVVYSGGSGSTEPEGEQPVTPDTLFMIGSITKSMTTMMMGTLVDDGVLDWDQPVIKILPSFALSDPAAAAQIKVRDLVNMSSGVPRYDNLMFLAKFSPQELIASLAKIPMVAAPGVQWNYSNQMVAAGGYISALATGASMDTLYERYVDLMQTRIFDRIGMSNTTFNFDAATAYANHALPYTYNPITKEYVPVPLADERFVIPVAPAGAVWSNAEDMARYLQTELRSGVAPDGEQVISKATLHMTQSPEVAVAGVGISYGMGWVLEKYHGVPLVWHNGGTLGFSSDLAFLPSADFGVVILTNAADAESFTKSVREYTFELAFGLKHPAVESSSTAAQGAPLSSPVDPEAVAPFLGTYEHGVTVEMRGDELWLVGAFLKTPLHPAGDRAGNGANSYIGVDVFSTYGVRFIEVGAQAALEITNLSSGETLTLLRGRQ